MNSKLATAALNKVTAIIQKLENHAGNDVLPPPVKDIVKNALKPINDIYRDAQAVMADSSKTMHIATIKDIDPLILQAKKADGLASQIIRTVAGHGA